MNYITEWLNLYFDEIKSKDFYRMMFPEGSLDSEGKMTKGKYCGIIVSITQQKRKDGKPLIKRYTVTDELNAVDEVTKTDDFCLISPLSYAGKQNTAKNARALYGIIIDLDHIRIKGDTPQGLIDYWVGHVQNAERLPKPTVIVSSGTGVHLCYLLEKPIPLFPNTVEQLQKFKHELTRLTWNEGIVDIEDDKDIQYEGIYQGFRMVGTITKNGARTRAFLTGEKVSMEYLNQFVGKEYQVTEFRYKSALTLDEAKEKYPEWYERKIVRQEPPRAWHVSRNLYDWWKRRVYAEARLGHRYHCMMVLVAFAMKCSFYDEKKNPDPVTYEELEQDCNALLDFFETLTTDENNHFTTADMLDALEIYQQGYINYPRDAAEYRSGIEFPKNKRNGRKQADHIKLMNFIRDELNNNKAWRNKEGRPKKEDIVKEWLANHPGGRKADCIRDLGIDRKTVSKYWKQ